MKKRIALVTMVFALLISCSKEDSTDTNTVGGFSIINNKKATGSSSHDLLSDDTFKSMVIELVYVQGYEPSATAISNFTSFLNARINKPGGITVVKRAIASPGKATFTVQEIVAIEDANRTKYNTANQIAVWALFIDGASASDSGNSYVLGTAYRNTSFVIYEKTIQSLSDSPFEPNRSLFETTIITHEFGHILGLTNLGAPLQSNHEDTAHEKHCNVESCLMYWSAESGSGVANMVSGGSAPKLDAQCLADLKANGGK
ncbi:zinc metalloprotease [Flavobacterium hiemivividum]|uniref:Membrane metalloprotease n=1 Tax=Flavobacterium hiemivividum TaxID=2541734 RepID=A0A4R5CTV1_9FLAO|nr:membrane metalloprotease [Flavobacterium hiemivividum]TDE03776.1 membrane metalloprotease [Flavobacterium hiemivividum]